MSIPATGQRKCKKKRRSLLSPREPITDLYHILGLQRCLKNQEQLEDREANRTPQVLSSHDPTACDFQNPQVPGLGVSRLCKAALLRCVYLQPSFCHYIAQVALGCSALWSIPACYPSLSPRASASVTAEMDVNGSCDICLSGYLLTYKK